MSQDPKELLKLERGWDSYDGKPVDPQTLEKAEEFAGLVKHLLSCDPWYVPTNGGEVQVEWHCDGWDVEIFVSRRGA
jgi:hypothetical protein